MGACVWYGLADTIRQSPVGTGAWQQRQGARYLKMVMARQVSMMAWLMRLLMRSTSASRSVPRNTCANGSGSCLATIMPHHERLSLSLEAAQFGCRR